MDCCCTALWSKFHVYVEINFKEKISKVDAWHVVFTLNHLLHYVQNLLFMLVTIAAEAVARAASCSIVPSLFFLHINTTSYGSVRALLFYFR